ncbi:MAG: bifunctional UDP-N-acetylglucosamine diphosphorylase/glucosamine-1-phosphate N-acetyltransferase GlmU [Gammaproteobacteria bacterium]|nr:bifunctional UDP-N-acetylglucosamine diphosphorylase/glucosamine-1-phosphate N-acetyltransferase GlmU [Gammaproteobacteria bacterium]NNJ49346.1 bifunctional UDP-N-acetylglucosamine diphosphorylase/glucosamine-1-phosphate N-acetyltransferase GlmU [Gammaproteobacteria bacterium]
MNLSVIILAAGAGTRMRSSKPKVLHKLAGIPMVEHVYNTCKTLGAKQVQVVYGHGGDLLKEQCQHFDVEWVLQAEQLGTAHAVQQASPKVQADDVVLILYGDVPLTKAATLEKLISNVSANNVSLLTVELDDPTGYGRIVRKKGRVVSIVEHKDASEEVLSIKEVNTGILAVNAAYLNDCLSKIGNDNAQGEYYLTDLIALAVDDGNEVITTMVDHSYEVEGINNRQQLARLERIYQRDIADKLLIDGIGLADPDRLDVRGRLNAGNDSFIDINCIFEGEVTLGTGVTIGSGCVIKNSSIASDCIIKPYSVIENAVIDKQTEVGPFARIRPGTHLRENSRVGNFVEIKNTELGINSKASHLTYLGDSEIGNNVNIGAGSITCNYDGANKFKTIIKDGAFIGSDTQLVAPVTVGENSTIAAGSTITKDTADDTLTLSRTPQKSIKGWLRPKKKIDK